MTVQPKQSATKTYKSLYMNNATKADPSSHTTNSKTGIAASYQAARPSQRFEK